MSFGSVFIYSTSNESTENGSTQYFYDCIVNDVIIGSDSFFIINSDDELTNYLATMQAIKTDILSSYSNYESTVQSGLIYTLDNLGLINFDSLSLSSGTLGSYVKTESSYSLLRGATEYKHIYEYGYVLEKYVRLDTPRTYIVGELNLNAFEVAQFISYEITSTPDTKIKTTCCLLVCCEPDKYELK